MSPSPTDKPSTPSTNRALSDAGKQLPQCATSTGSWRRRVFDFVWPAAAIALVLTGIFTAVWPPKSFFEVILGFVPTFVISISIGGVITLAYWILGRFFGALKHPLWHLLLHAVAIIGGVLVGVEIALRSLELIAGDNFNYHRAPVIQIGLVVSVVIVALVTTVERFQARARALELREERVRRDALVARYQALQARTNPHFLFNSLNAVAGLIEEDPKLAERAIEKLAAVFRYSLEGSRKEQVPLSEEIAIVQSYLEVEAMRLGERLQSSVHVDPGTENLAVPPLVLQPLVENAVLHGVAPRPEGGHVAVRAARDNGSLVLTVEDDGPGPGNSTHHGSQTAMLELKQRLSLLYGNRADLESGSGAAGGYRVRVEIPIESESAS